MILHGKSDEEFSLKIVGYEFPYINDDEWDSNWLLIETTIKVDDLCSTTTDPSLLTYEASCLASWLEQIALGTIYEKEIGFLEPNLSFEFLKCTKNHAEIRVYFGLESRPYWAREVGTNNVWIELFLTTDVLIAWCEDLRIQLKNFPRRALEEVVVCPPRFD